MKDECRTVFDSEFLELLIALKNEHLNRIHEQINYNGISDHSILKNVQTESGFNKWLNRVYDYCDMNRIWVEF